MKKTTAFSANDWAKMLQEWVDSGLSGAKWCRENNIPINAFRYWKDKFKEDGLFQTSVKPISIVDENAFVELSFASEPDTPCFAAGSETPPVEMTILMKGYPLLIHKGINAETLSTVMEVLSHA